MQRRTMLKSKIDRATVTDRTLQSEDSITVDANLLEAADIFDYELVTVLDVDNGARFETYAIAGERGAGGIHLGGAAGRLVREGDRVIVVSYAVCLSIERGVNAPRVVRVDASNHIIAVDARYSQLAAR
jgi:aspartate 1-decarboxylase